MTGKYHITPNGPKPCKANKRACKYGDVKHFDSREAAMIEYLENLSSVMPTVPKTTKKSYFSKEFEEKAKAYDDSHEKYMDLIDRIKSLPEDEREEILDAAEKQYEADKKAYNAAVDARRIPAPPREVTFDSGFGLNAARQEVLQGMNIIGDRVFFTENIEDCVEETLNRYHNGERFSLEENAGGKSHMIPDNDKLLYALSDENNYLTSQNELYAIMIMPEKDIDPILKRLGVDNVSISPMNNCRENGLVYSVVQPDGNLRSFSVYEHRNTDSLVINGTTNWDRDESEYGPYAVDNKNAFFAEFAPEDRKQVADTLGFFLKAAQNGDLENDGDLVDKADHRDWRAMLEDSVLGFKDWMEKQDKKDEE